jgi:hypothetical protein
MNKLLIVMEFIIVDQGQLSLEAFTTEQNAEVKKIIVDVRPGEC